MSNSPQQLVTRKIRLIMREQGMTHEDLALSLGYKQPSVTRKLSCKTNITVDELFTIAHILDVPVTALITR